MSTRLPEIEMIGDDESGKPLPGPWGAATPPVPPQEPPKLTEIFGPQTMRMTLAMGARPRTKAEARLLHSLNLLGDKVFLELPMWARALEWKAGNPDPNQTGPRVVLSQLPDGTVSVQIVGEVNELSGICDCCRAGFDTGKAWASLEITL